MRKLMFATALAASAAAMGIGNAEAMAAPINANDFSSFTLGVTLANGSDNYFYFDGAESDSVVTNVSHSTTKHTHFFSSASDDQYLALETDGGTLWCSLGNTVTADPDSGTNIFSLGEARNIGETGTYLDTLVQFTVTEDDPPEVETGDKLAIWLGADTNLMVKAKLYDFGEEISGTATNFTLAPVTGVKEIVPGAWYRLTVKAIRNVMTTDENGVIPAFEIYIDDVQMCATTPQFTSAMVTQFGDMNVLSAEASAAIAARKLFPSLADMGYQGYIPTLQGVGFKGTGAIDEIVWTEENPFPVPPIEFTLTGAANATVSYVIGEASAETWDGINAITNVPAGTQVEFTATPVANYTYEGVTADGWTTSGTSLVYTTNATENVSLVVPDAVAVTYTLTVPTVANATLTSPASLSGFAPGAQVTLVWTASEGYTFPSGQTTYEMPVTVNGNETINVSDVESNLSKQAFEVKLVDIENATVAATTNSIALSDALSENSATNQYTVEYGDTVTVTATPAEGYEYASQPEGWTLSERVISIETNVTAAVELAVPAPTAIPVPTYTLTLPAVANATPAVTAGGELVADLTAISSNTEVIVTWTPADGYQITAGATETITMDGNKTAASPTVSLIPPPNYTLTIPTVEHASAAATVGGEPVADLTAIPSNTEVLVTWTADTGYQITAGATETITMDGNKTATAPTVVANGWVEDVTDIPEGTTVAQQYPSLASTEVASADAAKLTTWAKGTGKVAFSDAATIDTEAFLLNIANDSTRAQKDAAFTATITMVNGQPVVKLPNNQDENSNTFNGTLKKKVSDDLTNWFDSDSDDPNKPSVPKFFKFVLSL